MVFGLDHCKYLALSVFNKIVFCFQGSCQNCERSGSDLWVCLQVSEFPVSVEPSSGQQNDDDHNNNDNDNNDNTNTNTTTNTNTNNNNNNYNNNYYY